MNNEKRNKEKKTAIKYTIILFGILIFLLIILYLSKFVNININKKYYSILSYAYILFFSISTGFIVYYGIDSFDNCLIRYFRTRLLTNLVAVTIVLIFCFTYSAIFKNILDNVFGKDLVINEWVNVIGFAIGRIIVIGIIFIMIKVQNKKQEYID